MGGSGRQHGCLGGWVHLTNSWRQGQSMCRTSPPWEDGRMRMPMLPFLAACLGILTLGCLSGSSDQGMVVNPSAPAVRVGEQLALTAEPLEDLSQEPEWEVEETYGGGF